MSEGLMGKTIGGRYRVTEQLGSGAMATVFRALRSDDGREVALKVLHPHLASGVDYQRRFRREAKAAAGLKHPNTVEMYESGVDGSYLYMAMELVNGELLSDILKRMGRLPAMRAAGLMVQVCDALAAAHRLGIVHRDLKPHNIMVIPKADGPDQAKVLDFGIAKWNRTSGGFQGEKTSSSNSALTTAGTAVGTPEYMSPEQCRGKPVDHRSDIYACGIVLYELCTGRVPFSSDVHVDTMLKQVRSFPTPPSTLIKNIDPELEKIILRALSKEPRERQQTAFELGASLRRVANPPPRRQLPTVPPGRPHLLSDAAPPFAPQPRRAPEEDASAPPAPPALPELLPGASFNGYAPLINVAPGDVEPPRRDTKPMTLVVSAIIGMVVIVGITAAIFVLIR